MTLSTANLRATTSVAASERFSEDVFWLNHQLQPLVGTKHAICVAALRHHRELLENTNPELRKISAWGLRIVSENNFPTAAGLASSAAGFAALVFTIANLYELPLSATDLSKIARIGSGSSCRSLFGGYVEWNSGKEPDGSDSYARQIATTEHWPSMCALVLVISAGKKAVSSTGGMKRTVETAELFPVRCTEVVPKRIQQMAGAIDHKDFRTFAELTMRDSNQFHAVCLDSFPPIFYLNDTSRAVISFVHSFNETFKEPKIAYTFDAGPNAVLYYLEEDQSIIFSALRPVLSKFAQSHLAKENVAEADSEFHFERMDVLVDGIVNVIYSKVGSGPELVNESLFRSDGSFSPA